MKESSSFTQLLIHSKSSVAQLIGPNSAQSGELRLRLQSGLEPDITLQS